MNDEEEMRQAMSRERPPFGCGFVGSREGWARNVNYEARTFDFVNKVGYVLEEGVAFERFHHYYAANH